MRVRSKGCFTLLYFFLPFECVRYVSSIGPLPTLLHCAIQLDKIFLPNSRECKIAGNSWIENKLGISSIRILNRSLLCCNVLNIARGYCCCFNFSLNVDNYEEKQQQCSLLMFPMNMNVISQCYKAITTV